MQYNSQNEEYSCDKKWSNLVFDREKKQMKVQDLARNFDEIRWHWEKLSWLYPMLKSLRYLMQRSLMKQQLNLV